MPPRKLTPSQQRDVDLIRSSEFFDEEFYLEQNPKVAERGVDPAVHYLLRGAANGKDPSARFSTKGYLERYTDVRRAGANPLVHFLRGGQDEGRSPDPQGDDVRLVEESGFFDEEYYRHFRPDVPAEMSAVVHYLRHGAREGFDPSQKFSTSSYLRMYPDVRDGKVNPLLHYLRHGRPEGRYIVEGRPLKGRFDVLYRGRWPELTPFPVVRIGGIGPRVTVLTDSVGSSSLFGGVGTALILGVQLANALGGSLRLATRQDPPDASVLAPLQRANGITLAGELEVADLPTDATVPLLMGEQEVLITTSWWTTRAALDSTVRRDEIVYLLQEDERMFYAYGDDRLLCSETLAERGFPVVVNTRRLFDHLAADLPHLAESGLSFEPAFPGAAGVEPARGGDGRRRFFFYSRPQNARNLFWRGGRALAHAIETNVLDPDEWSFHFVGRATPDVTFPRDVKPEIVEGLGWQDYQALVAGMDAALVLMDTPHPSYPPYDLAAAGCAVLTNRHPGKEDLSGLSRNILIADPTEDGLLEGLARVADLGRDEAQRRRNVAEDAIARDWAQTLAPTVEALHAVIRSRGGQPLPGPDVH